MPFGGLLTAAIIGVGGSIASSAVSAHAAGKAAGQQVDASNRAADTIAQSAKDSLDFQKSQWAQAQANMKPWLQYGGGAVKTLGDLMGIAPDTSLGAGSGTMGGMYPPSGAPTVPSRSTVPGNELRMKLPLTADGGGRPVADGQIAQPNVPAPSGEVVAPQVNQGAGHKAKTVRVAWPDGTMNEISSDDLQRYLNAGAEQV